MDDGDQAPNPTATSKSRTRNRAATAFICMGVSGAGKTTVGKALALHLACEFLDADDFHSLQNKEKMRRGIPLTDEDRAPWLEILRQALRERLVEDKDVVLACSALKPEYRSILRAAASDFGQEQAHAVGRSLGNDNAYVDGIAKDACRELGDERKAGTRAGGSWASHTGSSEDSLSTGAEKDVEFFVNGVRGGEFFFSRVVFVYLKADVEVLAARLRARDRAGTHYMPASLLESQIQTLQIRDGEPGIITKDANTSLDVLVRQIVGEVSRPDL